MALLLHLNEVNEEKWAELLRLRLGSYKVYRQKDKFDPSEINYILVWKPKNDAFANLDNLKAIFSLGAGVDALLEHKYLPQNVPIVRFVDDELAQSMSEYILANILMHHRLFTYFNSNQERKIWQQYYPPPASKRNIGIMGLGKLGMDVIKKLKPFGFNLFGWSRTKKNIANVKSFAGPQELDKFLAECEILVNLLPLTAQTRHILNYENFKKLKRSKKFLPVIINAGRGGHQKEEDIIKALKDKTLGAASLDVFENEPLAENSPLWEIKNCYITPHIAAISNPKTGVEYFAKMLIEHEKGKPLTNLVNMDKGY